MEGPRSPYIAEYDSLLRFLNQNLRAQNGWSILDEYPTALGQHNLGNIRIIKEKDEILSHAVLKINIIKTPIGIFKVAAIGSVVTHNNFRNQGLSQKIIENCLISAKEQGCDFAILWTNLFDFYRKFGFELAGSELSYVIDKDLAIPPSDVKILKGAKIDAEALLRLYSQHTVSSIRTFDEVKKYLSIPNSNVYTAWSHEGQLQAYIVEGKGADLGGYIHEWGGGVSHLLALVNYAFKDQKRPLTMIVPQHSVNLVTKLRSLKLREVPGFLGMIKIITPNSLFGKITRAAKSEHGNPDFILEKKDNSFLIGSGETMFKTDSESDIVRLIFGPQKPSEIHKFDPKTLATLEKIVPVPMWIWGWDSV